MRKRLVKPALSVVLAAALAVIGLSSSASAHEGEFARFDQCPSTTPEVFKCLYSLTEGGEVVLGKKTVPIVNPVTLQGGFSRPEGEFSRFFGAANGETLSKSPQPVPGGLLGLIPPESSPQLIKELLHLALEEGLTGVTSTLELARPASEIKMSEVNLLFEEGVALQLPVKVHLENPMLGDECYVGSSDSPIIWNLTTGETSPPPPNIPIHGSAGVVEFRQEGRILHDPGAVLVDNAWSAPEATGCGGLLLSSLIDPIIDSEVGLPSPAGSNTAKLEATSDIATALAVNNH